MRLVFLSNYYNHHQHSLCQALYQGAESFHFVETAPMDQERRQLGWGIETLPPYVTADLMLL